MKDRTEALIEIDKLRFQAKANGAAASGIRTFLNKSFGYTTFGKLLTEEEYGTLESIAARLDTEADDIFQKARKAEGELLVAAVEKIQLRADSVREEDQEVFSALTEMGFYGQYAPGSKKGETAFILVSRSGGEEPPAKLSGAQIEKLKALSVVEDVIFAS